MKRKMLPKSAVQNLISAIDRYIAKADQNFRDEIEAEGFLVADAAVEAAEALEDGMTGAINEHVDGVLETLGDASSLKRYMESTWPDVQNQTDLREKLHDLFYTQFSQLLRTGVVAYLKDSDEEVGTAAEEDGRVTSYATEFINGWSGQLAEIMHLSTDRQINKILVDSAEKNLSISETALAIGKSSIRSPGARSRVVAQTEVLRVESYSHLEAMRQDPATTEKEWVHTGSHKNKPRENHVAISGQTVPVDQPFSLSGYSPMCPRDTNLPAGESINCHCIMRQKKDSKVLGLSADERKALREKYLNETEANWDAINTGLNNATQGSIINLPQNLNQDGEDGVIPSLYVGNYDDFEELTLDEEERAVLKQLRTLTDDTEAEYGIAWTKEGFSKPFTSGLFGKVQIPEEYLDEKEVSFYHAHTNDTLLSGGDFSHLTRENVSKVVVSTKNGDIFAASVGDGYRPTMEEYKEDLLQIRHDADTAVMENPDFWDWTPEQRTYMAIREQAYLIARRYGWRLEGGAME